MHDMVEVQTWFCVPSCSDPDDPMRVTDATRKLGLMVRKGPNIMMGFYLLCTWYTHTGIGATLPVHSAIYVDLVFFSHGLIQ